MIVDIFFEVEVVLAVVVDGFWLELVVDVAFLDVVMIVDIFFAVDIFLAVVIDGFLLELVVSVGFLVVVAMVALTWQYAGGWLTMQAFSKYSYASFISK